MQLYGLFFWIICAIYLFNIAEFKVTNYVMKTSLSKDYKPVKRKNFELLTRESSLLTLSSFDDVKIYLSLADNPFGSSRFVSHEDMPVNVSFPSTISQSKPSPSTSSVEENLIDTGQHQLEVNQQTTVESSRSKRGVLHLYNMVKCATGCDPLSYKGYGCYCGFLGSGKAVNGIDRCCKKHDWCYNNAGCPPFFEYVMPYYWMCYQHRPICAIEHGEFGGRNSCARRLCECDRVLSECLRRYPCPNTRALCHTSPWRLLQNAFMLL